MAVMGWNPGVPTPAQGSFFNASNQPAPTPYPCFFPSLLRPAELTSRVGRFLKFLGRTENELTLGGLIAALPSQQPHP